MAAHETIPSTDAGDFAPPPMIAAPTEAPAPAASTVDAPVEELKYGGRGGGTPEAAKEALGHYADDEPAAAAPAAAPMAAAPAAPDPEQVAKIKELAADLEDPKWTVGGFGELDAEEKKRKLAEAIQELPLDQRAAAVAAITKETGDDALRDDQAAATTQALTEATKLDEVDKLHEKRIATSVEASEKAAAVGDKKAMSATLDDLRPSSRKEALDKMTPAARAVADEVLAHRRAKLEKAAETLRAASAGGGTNEVAILKTMSGLSPTEAAELDEIYAEKFKDGDKAANLRKDLKGEFSKGDKELKFIDAVLDGDKEAKKLSVDLTVAYIREEKGALINTNEADINDLMRAHVGDPEALAMISSTYKSETGTELTEDMKEVMNEAELKENTAYQRGDKGSADVAVLQGGDDARKEMVVEEAQVEPDGIKTLAANVQEHDGRKLTEFAKDQLPEGLATSIVIEATVAQNEIAAKRDKKLDDAVAALSPEQLKEANKKAEAIASKLATELSKTHVIGNNTEVTEHLRGLSPAEIKLVMDHYKQRYASIGDEGRDLEKDLRGKLDGKDLKVANAVLSGDKVVAAVAFFEQGADGTGTNVVAMQKALDTLETPEERAAFLAKADQHVGGTGGSAAKDMIRSETSSYDRDDLNARTIVDTDERAGAMAVVEVTRHAYGGKYNAFNEGLQDTIGDWRGEDDQHRNERRQMMRETDLLTMGSNLGGSEDKQLDAMKNLTDKQIDIMDAGMKKANGESLVETLESEMSAHHLDAGKKFAEKDHEGGTAEMMVAELDCYVNDRENEASLSFENPRIDQKKLAEIAKAPPEKQAAMLDEAKASARESLLEAADKAAKKAGKGSYMEMLEAELTPAQLAVAKDRIKLGKVSDVNTLFAAGDTTVGNLGKDPAKFYEVMQDKTPAEMKKLEDDFLAAKGVPLKEWVLSKATSDGEKRDFNIMLEGNYARMDDKDLAAQAAEHPQALIKRVKDLHQAATAGAEDKEYDPLGNLKRAAGNAVGNKLTGSLSNIDEALDKRLKAVTDLEAKIANGETLSADEQKSLIDHTRYMAGDQKSFTEAKTAATGTVAEVGGTIVEWGTVAATGSTTAGEVAGGLAKMEIKGSLDSGRYSVDQQVGDLIEIGGNAALSAGAGKLGKNPFGEALIEGAGGSWVTAASNTRNLNDGGDFVEAGAGGMVEGGAAALAALGTKKLGDGALGSLAEATSETLITGDYSKNIGDLTADTLKSAGKSWGSNRAEGHHKTNNPKAAEPDAATADKDPAPVTAKLPDAPPPGAANKPVADAGTEPDVDAPSTAADPAAGTTTLIKDVSSSDTEPDAVSTHPIKTVDAAPDIKPSVFGEEAVVRNKREVVAQTDDGKVTARVVADEVTLKFDNDDVSIERKEEIARDALTKLGLRATPEAIADAVRASREDGQVRIAQQLAAGSPEGAAEAARALLMTPDKIAGRADKRADDYGSDCAGDSEALQRALAEQGIFVPIMNAASSAEKGNEGHKFLLVGDTIICPSIGQYGAGDVVAGKANQYEPYIGSYKNLVKRVQAQIDAGQMPGFTSATAAVAHTWGLRADANAPGGFVHEPNLKPYKHGLQPKSDAETQRLMAEQTANGTTPGEGLPPERVARVKAEQERELSDDPAIEVSDRDPGIGSLGVPLDPNHVPGPGEKVNWGANDGGIGEPVLESLPPGTELHRRGSPSGSFFSPERTPIPERSLPPNYGEDGVPLDYTPEEYFYTVGPKGMTAETNAIAPGFNQPGGGLQYQAPKASPTDRRKPNMDALVADGRLIETQQNKVHELTGADRDDVIRIAAEAEASARRREIRERKRLLDQDAIDPLSWVEPPGRSLAPVDLAAMRQRDADKERADAEKLRLAQPMERHKDAVLAAPEGILEANDRVLVEHDHGAPPAEAAERVKGFADLLAYAEAGREVWHVLTDAKGVAAIDAGKLGNAVFKGLGELGKFVIEAAVPGAGAAFSAWLDASETHLKMSMPDLHERIGGLFKHFLAGEDKAALEAAGRLVSAAAGHTGQASKNDEKVEVSATSLPDDQVDPVRAAAAVDAELDRGLDRFRVMEENRARIALLKALPEENSKAVREEIAEAEAAEALAGKHLPPRRL